MSGPTIEIGSPEAQRIAEVMQCAAAALAGVGVAVRGGAKIPGVESQAEALGVAGQLVAARRMLLGVAETPIPARRATLDDVARAVVNVMISPPDVFFWNGKYQMRTECRALACKLAIQHCGTSCAEIAKSRRFGLRSHSAVSAAACHAERFPATTLAKCEAELKRLIGGGR